MGKELLTAPCNLPAPGLATRFARLIFACSGLITACSAPVPGLLRRLFRAPFNPQPAGNCQAGVSPKSHIPRTIDFGAAILRDRDAEF